MTDREAMAYSRGRGLTVNRRLPQLVSRHMLRSSPAEVSGRHYTLIHERNPAKRTIW